MDATCIGPRRVPLSEVSRHTGRSSVWIVIHNDVLDVSRFLDKHPGGADKLLKYAGTDATDAFERVGHSHEAREIAAKLKIGWLPPPERTRFNESLTNISLKPRTNISLKPRCVCGTCKLCTNRCAKPIPVKKEPEIYIAPTGSALVSKKSRNAKPHNLYGTRPEKGNGPWKWIIAAIAVLIIAGVMFKKVK